MDRCRKTLTLRYTVPLEIEVPEDFSVSPREIEKVADWRRNDRVDGRRPFASELLHDGALRAAQNDLDEAIDSHYRHAGNWHMDSLLALVVRCRERLGRLRLVDGGRVEVSVARHPLTERYVPDPHVVLCRDDTKPDGSPGDYGLATRTVFEGREAAEAYAFTVADSRGPVVVKMPLDELRVGEDRGRLDYWRVRKSEPAV